MQQHLSRESGRGSNEFCLLEGGETQVSQGKEHLIKIVEDNWLCLWAETQPPQSKSMSRAVCGTMGDLRGLMLHPGVQA